MPDPASVTLFATALGGISSAMAIGKTALEALRSDDGLKKKAEIEEHITQLMRALSDAEVSLFDARRRIMEKDTEIARLEEALRFKENLVKHLDAYYAVNAEGNPTGEPYCLTCWEGKGLRSHLTLAWGAYNAGMPKCTQCGEKYPNERAPTLGTP